MTLLYAPTPHMAQAAEVEAPAVLLYEPARQFVHDRVPVVMLLYAPAAHATHKAEVDTALRALYAPAAHAVHTREVDAAAMLPYVPVAHAVHTNDVLAPRILPYIPFGHEKHTADVEALVGLLYEPAEQSQGASDGNKARAQANDDKMGAACTLVSPTATSMPLFEDPQLQAPAVFVLPAE